MGMWGDAEPDGCDCCGHDAEDCGMLEDGWVCDSELVPDGVFCRECAHLLRIARRPERCAWCETLLTDEGRAEESGWAFFADEYGHLHPCCPGCLAGVFGITSRVALRHDAG